MNKYTFAAVVWDLDGTLIDTEPLHAAAMNQSIKEHGFESFSFEETIGLCLQQTWRLMGGEKQEKIDFNEWVEYLHLEFMNQAKDKIYLRPGVKNALETIALHKIPQACATNSPRQFIDFNLRNVGIAEYFLHTVSRDDAAKGKPAPDIYLKACEKLNVNPSSCAAVEDTPVGIQAAKAAGMTVIAFPNDATQHLDLSQADKAITDASELLHLIGIYTA